MPTNRTLAKRRADRVAQQKKRGSKTSPATEAENAKILLAFEAGELTEGQASAALNLGYVATRELRDTYVSSGILLAGELQGNRIEEEETPCPFRHIDLREAPEEVRARIMGLVEEHWLMFGVEPFSEVHFLLVPGSTRCYTHAVRNQTMKLIEEILAGERA